jgi:leader peptidase (prepilin peptidase)/N-methyltransferase
MVSEARSGQARHACSRASTPVVLGATIAAVSVLLTALDREIPLAAPVTVAALVPAALVDVRAHRLPNRLVASAAVVGGVCVTAFVVTGAVFELGGMLGGAVMMSGPLLAMHLVAPRAMGFGDVKAAAVLGAALGLVAPLLALVALVIASAATATVGLALRRPTIPFGPGLVAGAIAALALAAAPLPLVDQLSASASNSARSPIPGAASIGRTTEAQ